MEMRRFFHMVQPAITAIAVIATAATLVSSIYFTGFNPQWVTFLAGVLLASTLAEATRRSYMEWVVVRRTAQLSAVKNKLDREVQLRTIAEKKILDCIPKLHLIDEILPTMVAFVDREGCCQYHNRAFREWRQLRPEQIDRLHMREVLGAKVYQETATAVRQSLDGHALRYVRTEQMPDGAVYKLSVQHLPQFGPSGNVTGFYMLITDITEPGDVHPSVRPGSSVDQDMFVETFASQVAGQHDMDTIMQAIENNEFTLFCQLIAPVSDESGEAGHYEILVRLLEEEEGVMPPGMFFPFAEQHGLMPHLDRWVLQNVSKWIARQNPQVWQRGNSLLFINVSEDTIIDPGFPEFLQLTLLEHAVFGSAICFEIPYSEISSIPVEVVEFTRQVRRSGCRIALSGFGRDKVSFDRISGIEVDFLKIDGSTILGILQDQVKLSKVTAINMVAKKVGVKTIAEMVENEETMAKLKEIGIDFAQGFGISRPCPLEG